VTDVLWIINRESEHDAPFGLGRQESCKPTDGGDRL